MWENERVRIHLCIYVLYTMYMYTRTVPSQKNIHSRYRAHLPVSLFPRSGLQLRWPCGVLYGIIKHDDVGMFKDKEKLCLMNLLHSMRNFRLSLNNKMPNLWMWCLYTIQYVYIMYYRSKNIVRTWVILTQRDIFSVILHHRKHLATRLSVHEHTRCTKLRMAWLIWQPPLGAQ